MRPVKEGEGRVKCFTDARDKSDFRHQDWFMLAFEQVRRGLLFGAEPSVFQQGTKHRSAKRTGRSLAGSMVHRTDQKTHMGSSPRMLLVPGVT